MCSHGRGLIAVLLLGSVGVAAGSGDRICNMPETGTLQAGAGAPTTANPAQIRLASTASTDDRYYVGSKIQITGGTGAGASAVITRYCGQTHATCQGLESTGTLNTVSFAQDLDTNKLNTASTLLLELPPVDGGGRSIAAGAPTIATCSSRLTSPYMTDYTTATDCTGSMKGFNIYITGGTGAGSVGLIRAGPDANRKILVTGMFGSCSNTEPNDGLLGDMNSIYLKDKVVDHNSAACYDNWHANEPNCKANLGSPCILKSDCTGDPTYLACRAPVDAGSTFTIKKVGQGSDNCDPLCNGVASFTATVDFSVATDTTSTYSVQRGCYDERYATGMRRLGSSGSGAGMQNVHLDWKTLIPNGEVVASPLVYSNGDVVVASLRGGLTKLSATGEKYWSIYVGSVIGNPALGSDGTIYFGSGDRNIWAVTSNGITRWRYTTPMPVHGSPLVTDTGVFIGDRNGTFYRFNLDGSVAWKFHSNGEIWGGSAMTRDGRVVFGSLDTYLYCLNSTTGTLIFKATTGQEIVGTPLIQDVSIVYGTREDNDEHGQIVCLKMDGSVRWTYTVTSSIESQPAEGPSGEVFVSTVDGKIFAIQADGQLLWKYNTGGTGGVCKRSAQSNPADTRSLYSTEFLSVTTGDTDSSDGSSVVLGANPGTAPRYYRDGDAPSSVDGYYQGYRASFKLATGVLRTGQFAAMESITTTFAPTVATHDTHFTDGSSQDMTIVFSFKTQDRMVPGQIVEIVLPGVVTAGTDAAKAVYPLSVAIPAGQYAFAGASGTLDCATGCTSILVKLDSGGSCGADDACLGSTMTFLSGTGAGQTATIVDYAHNTLAATITYVSTVADATTTYEISRAIIPKFKAEYTYADPIATLRLVVPFYDGTMDCGAGCTHTFVKLRADADGLVIATDNALNGYFIQITAGLGKGQTTFCLKYYATFGCDVDTLPIILDATSEFRIGPRVEPNEETTLVIPSSAAIKYPHFSGKATGGSATTLVLDATAAPGNDFHNGMGITIQRKDDTSITAAISTLSETTIPLTATAAAAKVGAGAYLKIGNELMKVISVAGNDAVVERGQSGTTRATHAINAIVTVFEFRTVTDYVGATQTVTFAALGIAPAADDFYRISGVGPTFDFGATLLDTDFAINPPPYRGHKLPPATYSATKGKVILADELAIAVRADNDYVGAILAITDGPGKGLKGEITGYIKATGVADVEWNLDFCGDPAYCTPVGAEDHGTCKVVDATPPTTASCTPYIRKASHYEIQVVGAVASYIGSTKALGLTQLPGSATFSVPDTSSYCNAFDDTVLMNSCTTYTYVKTPVNLEWSSGSWCGAGGGTGWGATSPCVSNGVVVTTSANKFVYGLGLDGVVKFKYMTGKRIKSAPRCVGNADKTVTIYTGSNDHHIYKLTADAQKVLRGTSWYNQ